MYEIHWDQNSNEDMKRMNLRAYEVGHIVDSVEEQLTHQPERPSKRKKIIRPGEQLPFEHLEVVWQLRVGDFRVYYDVAVVQKEQQGDERSAYEGVVHIRAVWRKPPHQTTRDIL